MSSYNSPNIITEGLSFYIDAANPKSYPGSGIYMYDLSGTQVRAELKNGPTWQPNNCGVIALDGTNQYIEVSSLNYSSGQYTIIGAARYQGGSGFQRTFSALNNNWLMGHWSGYARNYYASGWITTSTGPTNDTSWYHYAATGDTVSDIWTLYVNGEYYDSNNGGFAGPNGFAIGSWQAFTEFSKSYISFMQCYTRVLSHAEVKRNYNAMKNRYSI